MLKLDPNRGPTLHIGIMIPTWIYTSWWCVKASFLTFLSKWCLRRIFCFKLLTILSKLLHIYTLKRVSPLFWPINLFIFTIYNSYIHWCFGTILLDIWRAVRKKMIKPEKFTITMTTTDKYWIEKLTSADAN